MTDVLNPVGIEAGIRACAERIHKGVIVVSNAEAKAREARHTLDIAVAKAYLAHEGPAHEKRYAAELATVEERQAADIAELAYRQAERTAKAIEAELRALQSVNANVRSMYAVETGVGR